MPPVGCAPGAPPGENPPLGESSDVAEDTTSSLLCRLTHQTAKTSLFVPLCLHRIARCALSGRPVTGLDPSLWSGGAPRAHKTGRRRRYFTRRPRKTIATGRCRVDG